MITSLQNQRVKNAIKLRGHREREKQNRFVIDGTREIGQAIAGGIEFDEVFVCDSLLKESARSLLRSLAPNVGVLKTNQAVWEKLTFGSRNDGLLATAKIRPQSLQSWLPNGIGDQAFIVILDQVEKPGNIGAVIRTADGAGASGVMVTDSPGDLFNPNVIRASLGAIFRMPVVACSASDAVIWLTQAGIVPLIARVDATSNYTMTDMVRSVAIVLGSEAKGVGPIWYDSRFPAIHIPMHGHVDSLNVSTSAAIVMYEALRQRGDA